MDILSLLALAVALAMDAFAVALSAGLCLGSVSLAQTLRMAGLFGFFQAAMPVLGWVLGLGARPYIEDYDHWLAFILLLLVGGHMIYEALKGQGGKREDCAPRDPTRGASLWLLALATSVDALAVGLSLALLNTQIWLPALVIGLVCFWLTVLGLHLGRLVHGLPGPGSLGDRANIIGGVVLLAIAVKILHEHGVFS